MAYDEGLATQVREVLGDRPGLAEADVRRARLPGVGQYGLRRAWRRPSVRIAADAAGDRSRLSQESGRST